MTKVEKWMKRNPITIDADASIIETIHLMKEKGIRHLPVLKQGKFAGLITEQIIKEYTPSKATSLDTWEIHYLLSKTPVKEAMDAKPCSVTPDTYLTDAAQLIHDKKLYGLCVLNTKGDLVGIMTTTDILKALITLCKNPQACQE